MKNLSTENNINAAVIKFTNFAKQHNLEVEILNIDDEQVYIDFPKETPDISYPHQKFIDYSEELVNIAFSTKNVRSKSISQYAVFSSDPIDSLLERILDHIPINYLNDQIFLMLAEYLRINPADYIDLKRYMPSEMREELLHHFIKLSEESQKMFYEIFHQNDLNDNPFEWRRRLFVRIVDFFKANKERININSLPSIYSFNLNNEKEIDIRLENVQKVIPQLNLLVF